MRAYHTFPVNGFADDFEKWLKEWHADRHQTNVGVTSFSRRSSRKIFWYFPDKHYEIGQITFWVEIREPEILDVTFEYIDEDDIKPYAEELLAAIKKRWIVTAAPFGFHRIVSDPDLITILEQRWQESLTNQESGAYLSTIILLGSILEGVLFDWVSQHPQQANRAAAAPRAGDKVLPFADWTITNLIDVVHQCRGLHREVRDYAYHLRQYRNLIHPQEQMKLKFHPGLDTCVVGRQTVNAALNSLAQGEQDGG